MTKSTPYEVIDNFLPEDEFRPFAYYAMSNFMYGPMDALVHPDESDGSISNFGNIRMGTDPSDLMFGAILFVRMNKQVELSDFYITQNNTFDQLEKHLNVKRWWRIRINCTTIQPQQKVGRYHQDYMEKYFAKTKTAILYLNSNNGGTKFEETGEVVQSKANRLVRFPTHTSHAPVSVTDAKLRFVMNMNYEEN